MTDATKFDPPILLDSKEGAHLVEQSTGCSHWPAVKAHTRKQISDTSCGLATAAIILQALAANASTSGSKAKFHEVKLLPLPASFKEAAGAAGAAAITWQGVQRSGLTLAQVATVLEAHGARIEVHGGGSSEDDDGQGLKRFRHTAKAAIARGDHVAANFLQRGMGYDCDGGHHSPLMAYHAKSDRFLLCDVWKGYPFAWFTAAQLWAAMDTVDADSGVKRGFIVVSSAAAAAPKQDAKAAAAADAISEAKAAEPASEVKSGGDVRASGTAKS